MAAKKAFVGICLASAFASPCLAEGWAVQEQSPAANLQLSYKGDAQASYLFECTEAAVIVTEFGVTDLLDLQTNTKVGDSPGAVMLPGAALMALSTDKSVAPDLKPAKTSPNPVRGWDMTIHLSKSDKALRNMAKARMVSVFTTGYTMAVGLNDVDRSTINGFLTQCGVKT